MRKKCINRLIVFILRSGVAGNFFLLFYTFLQQTFVFPEKKIAIKQK